MTTSALPLSYNCHSNAPFMPPSYADYKSAVLCSVLAVDNDTSCTFLLSSVGPVECAE